MGAVKLFSSKRRWAAAALILLALFLMRPGASRLKSRIASSISSGVGRPVEIGSVHLRLLPRPGFDLENLVVYDDPAFGAEPMLRASEVTAALRLTSLLRGRLEIATLELTDPSLNLVHMSNGRWNLEALLERTARISLAPTAKAKSEPRPAFPYIQATSARINFKSGLEKKPYALTNADFSLWQDSENSWGVRLKAQPLRTDMNLNDTGLLQVSGTWQRADALRDTPLQFAIRWNHAQLGQFTKFFTGSDQGWRGEILLDAALTGTPAKLQIASGGSIEDFRRYDITSGQALQLAARCDATYSSLDREIHELVCIGPVGDGSITLKGDVGLPGSHRLSLALTAENLPASAVMVLAQRAKKSLPEDVLASGTLGGSLRIDQSEHSSLQLEGRGEFAEFGLASIANKVQMGPDIIPFVIKSGNFAAGTGSQRSMIRKISAVRLPDGPRVEVGPFALAAGPSLRGAATPTVRGWLNRAGYSFTITGETEIGKGLRIARLFGVPALQTTAEGAAEVDLEIAGSWSGPIHGTASGFTGPHVTGTAKLRNVRFGLRGVAGPVEIASADLRLLADKVRVDRLNAKAAGTSWTGSIEMPRGCGTPIACEVHFVLSGNQIGMGELTAWVGPSPKERPWYRALETNEPAGSPFLMSMRASGEVTANRLQLQNVTATRVAARVRLDGGKLQIVDLTADFLGGKHRGQWHADFNVQPVVCAGGGNLSAVSLAELGDASKNAWIVGTANGEYDVKGPCGTGFWASAEGRFRFDVRDGVLPRVILNPEESPFRFTNFAGQAQLRNRAIEVKDARIDSRSGKFGLSGTASPKRELDLRLTGIPSRTASPGYAIGGTLAEPKVSRLDGSETQARLKADPPK